MLLIIPSGFSSTAALTHRDYRTGSIHKGLRETALITEAFPGLGRNFPLALTARCASKYALE